MMLTNCQDRDTVHALTVPLITKDGDRTMNSVTNSRSVGRVSHRLGVCAVESVPALPTDFSAFLVGRLGSAHRCTHGARSSETSLIVYYGADSSARKGQGARRDDRPPAPQPRDLDADRWRPVGIAARGRRAQRRHGAGGGARRLAPDLRAVDPPVGGFDLGTHEMQFVERAAWIPAFHIHYHLGVDGISMPLILLTTLMTVLVVLAGWEVIRYRPAQYMAAFLIQEGLMVGAFSALDSILFYVFWEALAHSDVPHHRDLGRSAAHLRHREVLPLHLPRLGADAGGAALPLLRGGLLRGAGPARVAAGAEPRRSSCSWRSWWRSR